jgi:hypothetical protein
MGAEKIKPLRLCVDQWSQIRITLDEDLDPHQKDKREIRIRNKILLIRIPQAASKTFRHQNRPRFIYVSITLPTLLTKPRCAYAI